MLICILKTSAFLLINFSTTWKPIIILCLINYHKVGSKARHKSSASSKEVAVNFERRDWLKAESDNKIE